MRRTVVGFVLVVIGIGYGLLSTGWLTGSPIRVGGWSNRADAVISAALVVIGLVLIGWTLAAWRRRVVGGRFEHGLGRDGPVDRAAANRPGTTGERDRSTNGDDVSARQAWFLSTRSDERGEVLRGVFRRAGIQRRLVERNQAGGTIPRPPMPPGPTGSVYWTPIGPSVVAFGQATNSPPVSGRVTAIVAGPGSSRVYLGSANGGVWYSGNT